MTFSRKSDWFSFLEKVVKISWSNIEVSILSIYTHLEIKGKVLEENITAPLRKILHCYVSPI